MGVSSGSEPTGTGNFRNPPAPTPPEREFSEIVRLRRRPNESSSRSSGSDAVGPGDIREFLSPTSPEPEFSSIIRLRRRRIRRFPGSSGSGADGTRNLPDPPPPTPPDQEVSEILFSRARRSGTKAPRQTPGFKLGDLAGSLQGVGPAPSKRLPMRQVVPSGRPGSLLKFDALPGGQLARGPGAVSRPRPAPAAESGSKGDRRERS